MKKLLYVYINISIILLVFCGCTKPPNEEENNKKYGNYKNGELIKVEEVENFTNINGFKVENGRFYFTGIKDDRWGFYELNLNNYNIQERYNKIGEYDVFIPLENNDAIYVDIDGNLFVRKDGNDKKIDGEIYGVYSPNIVVSPDQQGILYTKGEQGKADLYRYMLDDDLPKKIRGNISDDAFTTFSYTTHWGNEIYDEDGHLYHNINGTATKWSPNDDAIAFIKNPENLQEGEIFIGDRNTYIGTEFAIFYMNDKKEETIYENEIGLIDAVDSIQWSKDGSIVGLSVGTINKNTKGQLENIDYEKIFIYSFKDKKNKEVENMPYNFYEILFNQYVYGSSIGKRDRVEIVEVFDNSRMIFDQPVILNGKDMFIISNKDIAYLANGRELIEVNNEGESRIVTEFPWDVYEMYFDDGTNQLIITNRGQLLFLIKM